jgi:hypothetical protein
MNNLFEKQRRAHDSNLGVRVRKRRPLDEDSYCGKYYTRKPFSTSYASTSYVDLVSREKRVQYTVRMHSSYSIWAPVYDSYYSLE